MNFIKMKTMVISSFMIFGILSGCSNSDTSDTESKKDTLVMGTSADYKPFEYVDTAEGPEIIGFEVDIANYIADSLGYNLEIKDMDFNSLITAVKSDKVDFVMSGMTPTDERRKSVDFTDIYHSSINIFLTINDNNFTSVDDLNEKVVGVQTGSIQEMLALELKENGADIEIKSMNRVPELVQELKSNRIDGIIMEDAIAVNYLDSNEDLVQADIFEHTDEGYAIALKKGSELTEEMNEVIHEMFENGKMDELKDKWF